MPPLQNTPGLQGQGSRGAYHSHERQSAGGHVGPRDARPRHAPYAKVFTSPGRQRGLRGRTGLPTAERAVGEGAGVRHSERHIFWKQEAEYTNSKRKGAPNAGELRVVQKQGLAGAEGGSGSTF